jgi:hypothetical protein
VDVAIFLLLLRLSIIQPNRFFGYSIGYAIPDRRTPRVYLSRFETLTGSDVCFILGVYPWYVSRNYEAVSARSVKVSS